MGSYSNIEKREHKRHPFLDTEFPGIFLLIKRGDEIWGRGVMLDFSLNGLKFKSAVSFAETDFVNFSIKIPDFSQEIFDFSGIVVWCEKSVKEYGLYLTGIEIDQLSIPEWTKLYDEILSKVKSFEQHGEE